MYQPCILGTPGAVFEGQLLIGHPRTFNVRIRDTVEYFWFEVMVVLIPYVLLLTATLN